MKNDQPLISHHLLTIKQKFSSISPPKLTQTGLIKLTKQTLVTYLIIFIAFSGSGLIFLFNPFGTKSADAAWFNDNWAYRKAINVTVTSTATDQTNVDTLLTIDTNLGSSKLQSLCQDLRFTSMSGRILPYYISDTTSCNANATNKIWVRADFVPKDTTTYTMYMYYGNPSAAAGSDANTMSMYNGLQGYWKLNEASGNAADNSVNTNTLTNNNSTAYTTGQYGNSANFVAASSRSESIADASQTGLESMTALTISLWVNPTSLADNSRMVVKDSTNGQCSFLLNYGFNGQVTFYSCSNGFYGTGIQGSSSANSILTTSTWTHIVVTSSGGVARLYKNGVEQISGDFPRTDVSSTVFNSTSAFSLGGGTSNGSATYMNGKLDDVRVYNQGLSASQVLNLYNTPAGGPNLDNASTKFTASLGSEEKGSSPSGYWKFDDGQGTNAEDSTTNNNDGTLAATTATPIWQSEDKCISGKCLYYDGTDDKVTVSNTVSGVQTIGFWVKASAFTSTTPLVDLNGTAKITTNSSGVLSASGFTSPTIYVNGVVGATISANNWSYVTVTTGTGISASAIKIATDNTNFMKGFVDEAKLYNSALTASQVSANYNARSNPEGVSTVLGENTQNMPDALSDGLVGYWKMDESSWTNDCSTTSVADSSGNSKNGKSCPNSTGITTPSTGKFGNAPNFDGSAQYIGVASPNLPTGDFTYATWINADTTSSSLTSLFMASDGSGGNELGIYYLNSDIQVHLDDVSIAVTSQNPVDVGVWTHILVTRIGSTVTIYANGVAYATGTSSTTLGFSTCELLIGMESDTTCVASPGNYFDGKIDEARIYNRGLSPAEVSQLYSFAPGPVAYYKLDENSGQTVTDSSGNGNNGTVGANSSVTSTDPTWTPGKYSGALQFDGSNDYVNVPSAAANEIIGSTSFSAWVQIPATGAARRIFSKGGAAGNGSYSFYINSSGRLVFEITSDGTNYTVLTASSIVPTSTWIHVAATYIPSTSMSIYLNGVRDGNTTTSIPATAFDSTIDFQLGVTNSSSNAFNGKIDDAKIYNYARTQGQIVEDMNAGHPAPGSPVGSAVAHWKFDEGADNTCSGGTNDICNNGNSGNTYDGTSTATRTNAGKFNKALDFDGTDDVVSIANNTAIDMDGNLANFTFSSWVNADSDGESDVGKIYDKGASTYLRLDSESGGLDVECNLDRTTDTNVNVSNAFNISTWNHVACSWDGTTLSVYVNGQLRGSSSSGSGAIASDTNALSIGNNAATSATFDGKIDEFKVYSQSLTADQIKLDMNRGASQVMGAMGATSNTQPNSGSNEYCPPDSATAVCTGPVGEWKFDEGSGSTVNDSSGNSNSGTITGATYINGKVNKGLNFNGSTDTVSVSNSISTRSVEFWVNPSSTTQNLIDLRTAATAASISVSGGTIAATGFTSPTIYVNGKVSSTLTANTWQHVAVTTGTTITASAIRFGRISSTSLTGKLDQIRFFDYARSPAQIAWNYNKGAPIAHWKMDECQGTIINDATGNSLTGTLTNAASPGTCATSGSWFNGVSGKRNYSMDFDGFDDYISTSSIDLSQTNAITASMWLNWTSYAANDDLAMELSSNSNIVTTGFFINPNSSTCSGQVEVDVKGNSGDNTACFARPSAGAWHHYAIVMNKGNADATEITPYIDGIPVSYTKTASFDNTNNFANHQLYLMSRGGSTLFGAGLMDDTKIYNYPLTATQIKSLYNDGATRFGPTTGAP